MGAGLPGGRLAAAMHDFALRCRAQVVEADLCVDLAKAAVAVVVMPPERT